MRKSDSALEMNNKGIAHPSTLNNADFCEERQTTLLPVLIMTNSSIISGYFPRDHTEEGDAEDGADDR